MELNYFKKINNTYESKSKQESELFLLNRQVTKNFNDTIGYQKVKLNNVDFELLVQRYGELGNKKKIKSKPNQYINLGDIVDWNNQKWLITSIDTDDKTYLSGVMSICTILLRWQNEKGEIVERWCSPEYYNESGGTYKDKAMSYPDSELRLFVTLDDETKLLKRDKRFIIDEADVVVPDVYMLINKNSVTHNYGYFNRGKLVKLTLESNLYNPTLDNLELGICDYITTTTSNSGTNPDYRIEIVSETGNFIVKSGGSTRKFTAKISDILENVNNPTIMWEIDSFTDSINFETNNNVIEISVKNDSLIGKTFKLTAFFEYGNNQKIHSSVDILIEKIF